jgi:predicted deacylase
MDCNMVKDKLEPKIIKQLNIKRIPKGVISRYFLRMIDDGMGMPIYLPVMVAKGHEPGITLGITAAVHGNELNGIPVIQRLFKEIDVNQLKGAVVGVPVMNVPGFLNQERYFNDGIDLNRIMPGREDGNTSQIYAYRWTQRILNQLDYLLDLHTASSGRINSYYVRSNMDDPVNAKLAELQNAQIILHSPAPNSTVRGTISGRGGKAITLEVGDPNKFQKGHIRSGLTGIFNTLVHLNMLDGEIEPPDTPPIVCSSSYWIYCEVGGILQVIPDLGDWVRKDEPIAIMRNIFGDVIKEYLAPEDGIIIGRSINPVAQTGSRIIHLGIQK